MRVVVLMAFAVANDPARDYIGGIGVLRDGGGVSIMDRVGVDLGNRCVDTQHSSRDEVEELTRIGGSGIDQIADVCIAGCYHTVEGGHNILVALQLLQAADVCFAGVESGSHAAAM